MADINQAAQWLSEGKRVRRSSLKTWVVFASAGRGAIQPTDRTLSDHFTVEDLLASDWQIAPKARQ